MTASPSAAAAACWIWSDPAHPAPANRWTWFRKVVPLEAIPADATVRLAADSNARLWVNGVVVRRKVTRYLEPCITAEVIDVAPYLRSGDNVLLVLHHNWGEITTLQRTGNRHGGLWVQAAWVASDASWRCLRVPEIAEHTQQIHGLIGDDRIRYPVMLDARAALPGDLHDPRFDDSAWPNARVVAGDAPWPAVPRDVETRGQRESFVPVMSVLAAGHVLEPAPIVPEPLSIAAGIRTAKLQAEPELARQAGALISGAPFVLEGQAGERFYLTLDFQRPVHGYPALALNEAPAGTVLDLGYGELPRSQYSGRTLVGTDGWIDTEGVCGPGYADRITTRAGAQEHELPEERTARWLTLHIHFTSAGRLVFQRLGVVKSQYPIRQIGSFACGDERIEQIVKLCQIHAELTMSDVYVDTPGREDGQWVEDAQVRAVLAARWYGDAQLRRVLIRCLAEAQREDGELHPFAPSNYPAYPAFYDWGVQWVACLYDDYRWSGSPELVERYWETLRRYWACVLAHTDDAGLWRTDHVLADLRVGVRCNKPSHSSGLITPWIIERLDWSAELAVAVGHADQAAQWRAMAERMREAFRRYHVLPADGGVPTHVADRYADDEPQAARGYSQAGQTIAVTAGLLTPEDARADLEYAFPAPVGTPPDGVTRWNNPTYCYRVLSALSACGLTERAVAHLIERYSPYLPGHPSNPTPPVLQGPHGGPLPEYWVSREDLKLKAGEPNPTQPEDDTGSHGWGCVPLLWLHEALLGVRLLEPGGARLRIAPQAAGLPYVSGHTMTPRGLVWVWLEPQQHRLELRLPAGVEAEVELPEGAAAERWTVDVGAANLVSREGRNLLVRGA